MHQYERAVLGKVNVDLDLIRAKVNGSANGAEGILWFQKPRASM
jgi:hypothetical protein